MYALFSSVKGKGEELQQKFRDVSQHDEPSERQVHKINKLIQNSQQENGPKRKYHSTKSSTGFGISALTLPKTEQNESYYFNKTQKSHTFDSLDEIRYKAMADRYQREK